MKSYLYALAAGLLLAAPGAASAMDSASLLGDPARYRVVYAGEDEVAYADMTTVSGQQTMDYPGSIENVQFTLYVESYKDKTDAFDFAKDKLVTGIREMTVRLHANKRSGEYEMETALAACYDAKGAPLSFGSLPDEAKRLGELDADARDLYFNLYRLERLGAL